MIEYVLLGTSHFCQESPDFACCVEDAIDRHTITLVAEENPFNLPTGAQDRANQRHIPYLQIDLSHAEWAGYGIEREMRLREQYLQGQDVRLLHADALREAVWLDRIAEVTQSGRALVVCGYLHTEYLAKLIEQRGGKVLRKRTFPPEELLREPSLVLSPADIEEYSRRR
jgi:hypothetical protein